MIIKLTEFTERGEVFVNSDNILCFQKMETHHYRDYREITGD